MTKRKVFCEECRNDVDFNVDKIQIEGIIKGDTYNYLGKEVRCNDCNSEIYVSDINDYNLKALYDVYREKNKIVSLEIINKIPEKYTIGKRPLSLLLGWGELTFSRYFDGDMPTKQYSDTLQRIYDDPNYYLEMLEINKSNLKTESSYNKSKCAVDKLLHETINITSKIDLVTEYLLNQCKDITPLSLQKALYYTQGFFYAFYQSYIFSDECEAWIHGPVYRDIYLKYRKYQYDTIGIVDEFDSSVFTSSEIAILDSIIKNFCCYSGKMLECFTHSETPWLATRGALSEDESSNRIIEKSKIGDYFVAVKNKYKMINPNDIKSYSNNMFNIL